MSAFTSQPQQNRCVSIGLSVDSFVSLLRTFLKNCLPLHSFLCPLGLLHYGEIGRLQLGAGLVDLSLSDLVVNG